MECGVFWEAEDDVVLSVAGEKEDGEVEGMNARENQTGVLEVEQC